MLDLEGFLANVKRAAMEAVMASKPFSMTYGTVTNVSPLEISIDQKMTLEASQLILTSAVRDLKIEVTEDSAEGISTVEIPETEPPSEEAKTVLLRLALKPGEKVLLLRADGGQKYIVLDRVEVGE